MLILFGVFSIILCLKSCSSASAAGASDKNQEGVDILKVTTYNIHHANPPLEPGLIDIDGIVDVIGKKDPDLVALQEIDSGTNRSGAGNQAELIAKKLEMDYLFGRAISFDGGDYGVAILSKFPILEKEVVRLPGESGNKAEKRVLAQAVIQLPSGQEVIFGSTHLDHQGDPGNRLRQIEKLIEITSGENLPVILAGDFNDTPGSEAINLVDDHFLRTCSDCAATYPSNNPEKAIDFIILKDSGGKFLVKDHEVIQDARASDHLPVIAEILLQQ